MVLLDRREQESPASDCATGERPPSRGGEEEKEEREKNFKTSSEVKRNWKRRRLRTKRRKITRGRPVMFVLYKSYFGGAATRWTEKENLDLYFKQTFHGFKIRFGFIAVSKTSIEVFFFCIACNEHLVFTSDGG